MARSAVVNKGYRDAESDVIFTGFSGFPSGEIGPTEPPTNIDVPALLVNGELLGTAVIGDTLECTNGNWTGEPTDFAYQWKRNGTVNIGADDPEYIAVAADAAASIACTVTATNVIGSTAAPPSNAVAIEMPLTRSR